MNYLELRPYHFCHGRVFYYANNKWFEGVAPTQYQSHCPACAQPWIEPKTINHVEIHGNDSGITGNSYTSIRAGKIDRRTLKGGGSEIRYGENPIRVVTP